MEKPNSNKSIAKVTPQLPTVVTDGRELANSIQPENLGTRALAWFSRLRAERLRLSKQIGALEETWQSQVEKVAEQSRAEVEQARAHWRAQAAMISEEIRLKAEEHLRELETQKQDSYAKALISAYQNFSSQKAIVDNSQLSEELKDDANRKLLDSFQVLLESITSDAIRSGHDI